MRLASSLLMPLSGEMAATDAAGAGPDGSGLDDARHHDGCLFFRCRGNIQGEIERVRPDGSGMFSLSHDRRETPRRSFARYHVGFPENSVMLEDLVGSLA